MENKKKAIRTAEEMAPITRTEYEALSAENAALKEYISEMERKLDWLTEQVLHANRRTYGTSSEKADEALIEQLSLLFNEAEACADEVKPEPEKETVAAYSRKKARSGSVRDILPENIQEEVVEHRLFEEERVCPQCGETMEEIGSEVVETLKIILAQAILVKDVYYTYACRRCKEKDISTPVVKTPHKKAVIPGSFATPEAVAYLMTEKYIMHTPLYRMEQDFRRKEIHLSRQIMSNWLIRCATDWLKPVYDALQEQLVQEDIIHADETKLQVLREPGKPAQSDSFMWLYRTGKTAEHPIVLYEYQDNRRQENPKEFLKGFHGYLQTDGYAGYNTVEDVIHVGCWAHARRKFEEAVAVLPKGKKEGTALTGQAYCTQLFKIEEELAGLSPEERHEKRQEKAKPILDAMLAWAETRAAAPKSKLGTALTYLKNQWPELINYLLDGRLEISNNLAERSIKPFVMSRKNFLFSNTPSGATSSAIIFSLIETAKESGLNPYKYLTYVLSTAPTLDREAPGWVQPLLPQNAPASCKMPGT